MQGVTPQPLAEDVDVEGAAGFGVKVAGDVVAELDALPAVEAFIGLFVPSCGPVGVRRDGVGHGVGGVALELEGGCAGGGGSSGGGGEGAYGQAAGVGAEEGHDG